MQNTKNGRKVVNAITNVMDLSCIAIVYSVCGDSPNVLLNSSICLNFRARLGATAASRNEEKEKIH